MIRVRAGRVGALLGLVVAGIVAACATSPTGTEFVKGNGAHDCVSGCNVGVNITFDSATGAGVYVSNDTIYVPEADSTNWIFVNTFWTAGPNAEDSVISIATRVQTPDCAQACIREWDVSPNPLVLDVSESAGMVGSFKNDGGHTGHTTVTANAGAGTKTMNVTVY